MCQKYRHFPNVELIYFNDGCLPVVIFNFLKLKENKPKNPPSNKASSTKLKSMQKAYGVLPKDLSKSSSSTKSVKAVGGVSDNRIGVPTTTSQQRLRNSVGGGGSSTTDTNVSTSRKSYPPVSNIKSSSKIVAATRANYAEKYGGGVAGSPSKDNNKTRANIVGGGTMSTNRNKSNMNASAGSGSNNNSPYKQKTVSQKTPLKVRLCRQKLNTYFNILMILL